MSSFMQKAFATCSSLRVSILLVVLIFTVYVLSSFDVCGFPGNGPDKGFVFSPGWIEHLHSSEEWTIYYQTEALYEGRVWLTRDSPPPFSVDAVKIGDGYYALAEPVTAGLLLPFYTVTRLLCGAGWLVRAVIVGMICYTCLSALLVRQLAGYMGLSPVAANAATLLFAFATMAFSYSRLLYPQPIVSLLMLVTLVLLFRYKTHRDPRSLFGAALCYGLTVFAFNAFLITAPFFLYFLLKSGPSLNARHLRPIMLGLLPSIVLFVAWNAATTGNALVTPRQLVHPSLGFDLLYADAGSTWLNTGGLIGSLFSPVGIFFVSPILLAAVIGFAVCRSQRKEETTLLTSIILVSWLFFSLANLGGIVGRDFWVGGWANIARYMYIPSTLLTIFAAASVTKIRETRHLLAAWIVALAVTLSVLANLSYGVRHDLMIGLLKDFPSPSLLVWPYPLGPAGLTLLGSLILLASAAYPIDLIINKRRHRNRGQEPS